MCGVGGFAFRDVADGGGVVGSAGAGRASRSRVFSAPSSAVVAASRALAFSACARASACGCRE